MGLEPITPGTTTQCANQLRHAPHLPTPGRIRTSGRRLRRPLLCPLSYGRIILPRSGRRESNPRHWLGRPALYH